MSVQVMTSVFKHSESKLGARLVLLVLADAAHNDGVCWLHLKEISRRSKVSMTHISEECIPALVKDGELEVRKAKRGRKRQNVYRVCLPGVAQPDYDAIPLDLDAPFTGSDIPKSSERDEFGDPEVEQFGYSEVPIEGPVSSEPSPTELRSSGDRAEVEKRPQNLPFNALADLWPGYVAKRDGPRVARYLAEIRDRLRWEAEHGDGQVRANAEWILGQDDPDPLQNHSLVGEIGMRRGEYLRRWPDVEFTVKALAEHWTRLITDKPGGRLTAKDVLAQVNPDELGDDRRASHTPSR